MGPSKILGMLSVPQHSGSIVLMVDEEGGRSFCWLAKRAPSDVYSFLAGLYETGGGKRRSNETFVEAAIREMYEEARLDLAFSELVSFGTVRYRREDFNVELALFMVDMHGRVPMNTEPHKRENWEKFDLCSPFHLEPTQMTPATSLLVDMARVNLGLVWR